VTFGDREPDIAAVAIPIFGRRNVLEGSLTVSGPVFRFTQAALAAIVASLLSGGVELTLRLGGDTSRLAHNGTIVDLSQSKRVKPAKSRHAGARA
jgi:hypothetical protein